MLIFFVLLYEARLMNYQISPKLWFQVMLKVHKFDRTSPVCFVAKL